VTTLLHLSQSIVDMQQELAREQRFAHDACHNLLKGTSLLREALDALEKDIKTVFEERDRSVCRVLGNSAPYTTTIESDDPLGLRGPTRPQSNNGGAPVVHN
jgi:hypothetical protein